MTMTFSGKPSNNVRCDCAFSATVCMNAAIKLWQLELLKWKCWYIQYSKHTSNVHGLIHDWDIFLLFKLNWDLSSRVGLIDLFS